MIWEVEQKFRIVDERAMRARLVALGARFEPPIEQIDRYFNHPARDFALTDEALRLRQVGENNFVTYKGPKIDKTTKTRQEIELPLPPGRAVFDQFEALFQSLGFQHAGTVRKLREPGILTWEGHEVQVALDEVQQLGAFLELEIAADDSTLAAAKSGLESLARRLAVGLVRFSKRPLPASSIIVGGKGVCRPGRMSLQGRQTEFRFG